MTTLYLDVCCLNRPFDDQKQPRVRLEAEAVLLILARIRENEWQWVSSTVVELEIDQIPDLERKARIKLLTVEASRRVSVEQREEIRARELVAAGLGAVDALHISCAESAKADIFLTTDDKLLRQAGRLAKRLMVRVQNPLAWLNELEET